MQPGETEQVPMPAAPTMPPPPDASQPVTFGMRPLAVAGACLLFGGVAAVFAFRTLWPYPLRDASGFLMLLVASTAVIGFLIASRVGDSRRIPAVLACFGASVALPFVAVTFVPGVAQPRSHMIPGGQTQVLTAAPDGSFDLYLEPDGDPDKLTELTDTVEDERWAHLAPDGTKIVYTLINADGSTDLRVMGIGADRRIASDDLLLDGDTRHEYSATGWTPDGALLVMAKDLKRGTTEMDEVDLDTGALTQFLGNSGNLSFSPDGSKIVFARPKATNPDDWDIWVADPDGRHAHDVLPLYGTQDSPAWSPDGSRILYTGWVGNNEDVYVANADGSDIVNLTRDSGDRDSTQGWTSDGHVLFLSNRLHTGGTFLYFMNDDGTDVRLAIRL
jgi:Tol biopolymer transport system component